MTVLNEKAQRYVELLDSARAGAAWHDLPELIRKVSKHAPDRKYYIKTAKFDLEVANYLTSLRRRPASGASPSGPPPALNSSALEPELSSPRQPTDDAIQGQAALIWARWVTPPTSSDAAIPTMSFSPSQGLAEATTLWTRICVVKSTYIQGMLQQKSGDNTEGRSRHQSLLSWLDANRRMVASAPQLSYWAQQLLARIAVGPVSASGPPHALDPGDETAASRLEAFRLWAALRAKTTDIAAAAAVLAYGNDAGHMAPLTVWRAYYRLISTVAQHPDSRHSKIHMSPSELSGELRRVGAAYESELLGTLQFPKSHEANAAIESWVEEVISNWRALCQSRWSDRDAGEGEHNALGRSVLDVLYRAAAKSFQSTLILRRLFQVHKALADFDLAYAALGTYMELTDRARQRAAQSGGSPRGPDAAADMLYMRTIAEGIEGLCAFGRDAEAEKAYDLTLKLEDLWDEFEQATGHSDLLLSGPTEDPSVTHDHEGPESSVVPGVQETVYRAIGIGKAHWARWTPRSEDRSTLQADALDYLGKAAASGPRDPQRLNTLYALSRLLAETRDIDQAITVVKSALSGDGPNQDGGANAVRPRQLLPFWHLLALLLTSRQDFETAARSCAAAFEQFPSPDMLLGGRGVNEPEAEAKNKNEGSTIPGTALVDHMACDELQRILEIRITELALTELVESPEDAVNSSNDLLALYSRLFGRYVGLPGQDDASKANVKQPPHSSAGTARSTRGSIFSRRRGNRSVDGFPSPGPAAVGSSSANPHATAAVAEAITIQVTNEDEQSASRRPKLFRHSIERTRLERRPSRSRSQTQGSRRPLSRSRSRSANRASPAPSGPESLEKADEPGPPSNRAAETTKAASLSPPSQPGATTAPVQDTEERPADAAQRLDTPPDRGPHREARSAGPAEAPLGEPHGGSPTPDTPDALPDPTPVFSLAVSQRHALSLLVKIWLIIATLYRRAGMFDDAREACDEAGKAAMRVDTVFAKAEGSSLSYAAAGWAGTGKSSDELWADIYCERAELLMVTARAREEKEGRLESEGVMKAADQYEQCLSHFADHPAGMIGLSNVLLDFYERKVELAKRVDGGSGRMDDVALEDKSQRHRRDLSHVSEAATNGTIDGDGAASGVTRPTGLPSPGWKEDDLKKTPENLNRLAARDRAYGLLSTLTRLGSGWDNSEAWSALARAHEAGGEIDKAKDILWWCIELEDTRPIRHWSNVSCGGYVL